MVQYVVINPEEKTNPKFGIAFAAGCKGKTVDYQYLGGPWAGFGSPETWKSLVQARKLGRDFYYGDHAYFGRGVNYRVTKNAFQHTGEGEPGQEGYDRLKPYYEKVQPFKKGGAHVVVCPQSEDFQVRMGEPGWLDKVLHVLSLSTDREIIVRRKGDSRPLAEDLKNAHALVCHTSNAAVEALLAGVPVFCTGDGPASRFGLSDPINIEYPKYPDEDLLKFAAVLANNQWTLEEITAGKAWAAIK